MKLPLWRRRQREELEEELRAHLKAAVRERIERGESRADAETAARREFGNRNLVRETTRDMWGWVAAEQFFEDVRYSLRRMKQNPGFTAVVVVTLALGIAANTTIFGFVNGLMLRPFPLLDLNRLVMIWEDHPQQGAPGSPGKYGANQNPVAVADFLDLREKNTALRDVAAYRSREFVVTEGGEPERVRGYLVTASFFETIGVAAARGSTFLATDDRGTSSVVLLSHGFWQRRFGADPAIVGKTLLLGDRRHEIIGVLPQKLNFPPGGMDFFAPLVFTEADKADRKRLSVAVVASLDEPGSIRAAQAATDAFAVRLTEAFPDTNVDRTFRLTPLSELETGFVAPFLGYIEGASAFVLLIACANVAGLLIARGVARQREMAVRAALGAGRNRIVRQLLTEGLVLSAAGAGAGLWIATGSMAFIRASLPQDHARWIAGWSQIQLDGRTLAFTVVLMVATTLGFGLIPALRAARADLANSMKRAAGGSGPQRRMTSGILMTVQICLAVVLLGGTAFLTRGFWNLTDLYRGFDPGRVTTMRVRLPESRYPENRAIANFFQQVLSGVQKSAGVDAVGMVSHLPADLGPIPRTTFGIEGRPAERPGQRPSVDFQTITPGYLTALQVKLLRGRAFAESDGTSAPPVALISESLAETFWPGEDPLGRRIEIGDGNWREVVGVLAEVKQYWFERTHRPTLYVPFEQAPRRGMFLLVRSSRNGEAIANLVRSRVREIDAALPVDEVRTMERVVSDSMSFLRLASSLMGAFGLLAIVLAAVGLYGLMAGQVATQRREIGVRMALGAQQKDVVRLVVSHAARLVAIGLGIGLLATFAIGRYAQSVLFGIAEIDWQILFAVIVILSSTALGAAWIPARRATRIDPVTALRHE